MTRTKLSDRSLPVYSPGEERMNMITHIVGGGFGILALLACLLKANGGMEIFGAAIYGSSMILLYTVSSIYHGLRPGMAKKVMQVMDHCTIYFLIAGTYTPIVLCAIAPVYPAIGWGVVFFLPQTMAVLGAAGFWILFAGGVAYTVGAVLFGLGKRMKWMHSVFHIFVVLGSLLQLITVLLFVF